MSKISDEIYKIRAKHLQQCLKRYGYRQADLTKNGLFTKSDVSKWVNGKRPLTDEKLRDLKREFFPDIDLEYLLGDSEYMNSAEKLSDAINQSRDEFTSMLTALNLFSKLYGFSIEANEVKSKNIASAIKEIHHPVTITNSEGKQITPSATTLIRTLNEIGEFIKLRLDWLYREEDSKTPSSIKFSPDITLVCEEDSKTPGLKKYTPILSSDDSTLTSDN